MLYPAYMEKTYTISEVAGFTDVSIDTLLTFP
jgi:hypothetical protein